MLVRVVILFSNGSRKNLCAVPFVKPTPICKSVIEPDRN